MLTEVTQKGLCKPMLEKQIERKLVNTVKAAGGLCPKFVSPGMAGMPDRIVLMPGGRLAFVELKAPGKKPRPLQIYRHDQLRELGFDVFVLDKPEDIPALLKYMCNSTSRIPRFTLSDNSTLHFPHSTL